MRKSVNFLSNKGFYSFLGLILALTIVIALFYLVANFYLKKTEQITQSEYFEGLEDYTAGSDTPVSVVPRKGKSTVTPKTFIGGVRGQIDNLERQQSDRAKELEKMM